ncbi:MAG: kynureninase [Rubricella sp.]
MTDFARTRAAFDLPEGVIYLDGNSLGPLPRGVMQRAERVIREEWGGMLIRGWNDAGWMALSTRVGDRIARLVGAEAGSVICGDTLSIRTFQALNAALALNPDRRVILSDTGNFPSDLYIADGLARLKGEGYALRTAPPGAIGDALDETVAVLMLTEVDYRTGRLHDMRDLTERAHALGIVTVWDLAHSAGAVPVDLSGCGADFAVGCTYKYLNGGPGAPAFLYVAPRHQGVSFPTIQGWLGHAEPFAFEQGYRPAAGIARMRIGTPPVIQLAILDAALDVWEGVSMDDIRARSIGLSERFIAGVEALDAGLELVSPRDPMGRGSQVSFSHPDGYAIMQTLIADGVIGDFRAPDRIRFGFAPLYLDDRDIDTAVARLGRIMAGERWRDARFSARKAVT